MNFVERIEPASKTKPPVSGKTSRDFNTITALKAGVSVLALMAAYQPDAIAQVASDEVEVCCNGANGSYRYTSLVPSPEIEFEWDSYISSPSSLSSLMSLRGTNGTHTISFNLFSPPTIGYVHGGNSPGFSFSSTATTPVFAVLERTEFMSGIRSGAAFLADGGTGANGPSIAFLGIGYDGTRGGNGGDATVRDFRSDILTSGRRVHGLQMQANGGSGGVGGNAIGVGGVAGDGASGGAGGTADLAFQGDVQTLGDQSYGIWIRANGGAGGAGGLGVGGFGSGGSGSLGGAAGTVFLASRNNDIMTFGDYSHGILAEAVGGGGGSSGAGFGLVGSSGAGGSGVNGGSLFLDIRSNIATHGVDSHGIFAQSVGGGGGSAGAAGGVVALGDDGGASGNGAGVNLSSNGTIFTAGHGSAGIFAQSVGGGGGAGSTTGGLVALGGSGGAGGYGGSVEVENRGSIITIGHDSVGVIAQSIGGGGGYGGDSGGLVSLGGDASSGGIGGSVFLDNYGDIHTVGVASIGLFAQSVGGGGGAGGASGGLVAIGGDGEEASHGGNVTLGNDGDIRTHGYLAGGIVAQSVGGAGGRGGSSGGLVALGGNGTNGGHGGVVNVFNYGDVGTDGSFAAGIYAESIGGGGGSGGDTGGLVAISGHVGLGGSDSTDSFGGTVYVENAGAITTGIGTIDYFGIGSHGIHARSIGGGGGTGGSSGGLVALGGDATSGGYGGTVLVLNSGSIITRESWSIGILAESIGGGGGVGGSTGGLVALGGNASAGSHGGDVTVTALGNGNERSILTLGNFSTGILARSIGGGGGSAGDTGGLVAISGSVEMGGNGSQDAFGGRVEVESDFNIFTHGNGSSGIRAYSIGGGGGEGGDSGGLVALGGQAARAGYGGSVIVDSTGDITTLGNRSRGIFAESIGGGGGEGGVSGGLVSLGGDGSNGSHGGNVTVRVGEIGDTGNITTGGVDSGAIFARSVGGGGGYGGEAGGLVAVGGNESATLGGDRSMLANGGDVRVINHFSISTYGASSDGIFAQSVGGGGGSGGDVGGLVSIGGSASNAGYGGRVDVVNGAGIITRGNNARGIHAESLGGGGGEGGVSGGLVAIGGDGTIGGYGGNVRVTSFDGSDTGAGIATFGRNSAAIYARSAGGGAGEGGDAGGLVTIGGDAEDEAISIGGNASFLSFGGTVSVFNSIDLLTFGSKSAGIFAQSIGGGGGTAGDAGGLVSLGGDGSFGGFGGEVIVENSGSIATFGHNSSGIRAESLGGGGGEGGVSGGLVSLGGDGTFGGFGGDVSVLAEASDPLSMSIETFGNHSHGIFARSIGGGGGDGGDSGGLISLGGDADNGTSDCGEIGCGNYGGNVSVINQFTIRTRGDDARGIHAESIGGGGGTAGDSGGIVSLGGDGGTSGYGGNVDVSTTASIFTVGNRSAGIFAESIGGGGGSIHDTEYDFGEGEAPDNGGEGGEGGVCGGLICLGGDGIAGGHGGDITVITGIERADGTIDPNSAGTIVTAGNDSSAIYAQSIGGGGGDGGESGGIVSLGGDGGEGSFGGAISITNTFRLWTGLTLLENGQIDYASAEDGIGVDSDGIFARSIGGGGGSAGDSGGLVSLGGTGDSEGQNGGNISVLNNGYIYTAENFSRGIYAESIGGGGGDGGVSGGFVSLGGDGSSGGFGGDVSVVVGFDEQGEYDSSRVGSIQTLGNWSDGILARSVGGGGGDGGDNGGFISLGGDGNEECEELCIGGASNAIGGTVDVHNTFNLITFGDNSRGIFAESIGGGGGNGGDSYGAFAFFALAIGGDGGFGGHGGNVSVTHDGFIYTEGEGSTGIFAQSKGGGGGNGGVAYSGSIGAFGSMSISLGGDGELAGDGGVVDVTAAGSIYTLGNEASGIFAQSIGGGGGTAGKAAAVALSAGDVAAVSMSIAIGGDGGASGVGGDVTVDSDANIFTTGFLSHGINAQSVGGGGGSGGLALAASASASTGPSVSAGLAIGGDGGSGGDGGLVSVFSTGNITTGGLTSAPDPTTAFDPDDEEFDDISSLGIFAQSVGGGGGEGGMAIAGSIAVGTGVSVGMNFSLGGAGGAAGDGGQVFVSQSGNIRTRDHFGGGIFAQSLGGGGGRAGMAGQAGISVGSAGIQAGAALGGSGGGGGHGDLVIVESFGTFIRTSGQYSIGIEAQSIGGGGGSGGQALSGNLAIGGLPLDLTTSLGGEGGFGGSANAVSVHNTADIYTAGLFSHGILAQSVGGGGGNAGVSGSFSLSFGTNSGSLAVNLGGECDTTPDPDTDEPRPCSGGNSESWDSERYGDAGRGVTVNPEMQIRQGFVGSFDAGLRSGAVTTTTSVKNIGDILTAGRISSGIIAQSIGGGGGNGGAAYTGSLSISQTSGSLAVGLGGSGGYGGYGGNVFVEHSGSIHTGSASEAFFGDDVDNTLLRGVLSHGIVAQSVGGGGGNGGMSVSGRIGVTSSGGGSIGVTLGGDGGLGGRGGDVLVVADGGVLFNGAFGGIITEGHLSNGILAQSIGGGGGNGGMAGDINITGGTGQSNAALGVTYGGTGVGGGIGGVVDVRMGDGYIATHGIESNAIVAQSVGGGGGNGGATFTGGVTIGKGASAQIGVAMGGTGGAGNAGGFVSVENAAFLSTGGAIGFAINPVLDAERHLVVTDGEIDLGVTGLGGGTVGSHGIFAQSLGGGGGNGGVSLVAALAVGGQGGGGINSAAVGVSLGGRAAAGDDPGYTEAVGGDVWVSNSGGIATHGNHSSALFAQSLGGGGGNGGWAGSFAGTIADDFSASGSVSLGGNGGVGNRGGIVRVNNTGDFLYTRGIESHGIFASSEGGGGGTGGMSIAGAFGKSDGINLSLSFGGTGGSGGEGREVTVYNSSAIYTEGERSSGIFAQSLGGGGGNGGLSFAGTISASEGKSFNFSFGGTGGDGNNGGAVTVENEGLIITTGDESHSIFAQSLGGGGGNGGTSITGGLVRSGTNTSINFGLSVGGEGGGTDNEGSAVTVRSLSDNLVTTGVGSHGVFAQSIGGGGGNGGMAVAVALANTNSGRGRNVQAVVGVGGDAGEGSEGGTVSLTNISDVMTLGDHSIGLFAQSIGGGGGTAGGANSVSFQLARICSKNSTNPNCGPQNESGNYNAQLNFGGTGGSGNDGGDVDVFNEGILSTFGDLSHGILAQSVGGGGGEGGDAQQGIGSLLPEELCVAGDALCVPGEAISLGIDTVLEKFDSTNTGDRTGSGFVGKLMNLSLGGSGGASGDGGVVDVTNVNEIHTRGDFSLGIIGHSVGGGGGAAGTSGAGGGFSFGGDGAASGDGGNVTVNNWGTISTEGRLSVGILAQSVGGGGGTASHAGTFLAQDQWPDDYEVHAAARGGECEGLICVGGDGGASGDGGIVELTNEAMVETKGAGAHALFAQSVGGGGGSFSLGILNVEVERTDSFGAGSTGYIFSQGGRGGAGGDAGETVTVTNSGTLITRRENAHGIFAQSIGGGGGAGGVQLDEDAPIYTVEGLGASIIGDFADNFIDFSTLGAFTAGGEGGSGGMGRAVFVENSGVIQTDALGSYGIYAQSIGGGGGATGAILGLKRVGGENVGLADGDSNGGDVEVRALSNSSIIVQSQGSRGIFAQSIGGGGGAGGLATHDLNMGSDGEFLAHGGDVSVFADGTLVTLERDSRAIHAQSVGGGGGSSFGGILDSDADNRPYRDARLGSLAGGGDGGDVRVETATGTFIRVGGEGSMAILAQSIGAGGGDLTAGFARMDAVLGATGNARGDGHWVRVENCATVEALEGNSYGIVAQSIGGGGGALFGSRSTLLSANVGGGVDGNGVGDGGVVDVEHCGRIDLGGDNSVGVLAQSIGGGGGLAFNLRDTGIFFSDFSGHGAGEGGLVEYTQTGNIYAAGDDVFGVVLQSIGGGGGWVYGNQFGTAGGTGDGGVVDFIISGDILTTGLNSTAIFAQSVGANGGGDIIGRISSYVRGGDGTGVGLLIDGGQNNSFAIESNGVLSAVSGAAIRAGSGNDAVTNSGVVVGSLDLGTGLNSFNNNSGSIFVATGDITIRSAEDEPVASPVDADPKGSLVPVMEVLTDGSSLADTGAIFPRNDSDPKGEQTPVMELPSEAPTLSTLVPLSQVMVRSNVIAAGAPNLTPESAAAPSSVPSADVMAVFGTKAPDTPVMEAPSGTTAGSSTVSPTGTTADAGGKPPLVPVMEVLSSIPTASLTVSPAQPVSGSDSKDPHTPVMEAPSGDALALGGTNVTAALTSSGREAEEQTDLGLILQDVADDSAMVALLEAASDLATIPALAETASVDTNAENAHTGGFTNSGTFLMGLSAGDLPIDLAAGDRFDNLDGFGEDAFNLLSGARVINTIHIEGDFIQTASGHLVFDTAFGPYDSDQIIVSGDAIVAGTGEVTLTWLENAVPVPLFTTGGVGVYEGLEIQDSAAIDYTVTVGSDGVFLNIETDFGVMFSGANGEALGAAMDAALLAGEGQSIGRLLAMLGNMDVPTEELSEAIGVELNPEAHLAPMHAQLESAEAASRDIFSCGQQMGGTQNENCVWTRISRSTYDREGTADAYSVSRRGARFAGGFEQRFDSNWTRAVSMGFEQVAGLAVDTDRAVADGQSMSLAVGVRKLDPSGFSFGTSLAAGWSWGEMQRRVSVFKSGIGTSEYQTGFMRLDGHFARRFGGEDGGFFIEPQINVAATALRHNGLTETGLSGYGAGVDGNMQWLATASPELTLGHAFVRNAEHLGELTLTLGGRFASRDELNLPIRFEGTSALAEAGDYGTSLDDIYTVSTGLRLVGSDDVGVDIGYRVEFNDDIRRDSARVDLRFRF
jgi:hypothetical protein